MENDLKINSDNLKKQEWKIPTIEILNFKKTMGGTGGSGESTSLQPVSL